MNNKPNFVVIHTDQQRGDCLGIEGRKGLFTPNMDYMAVSGARFSAAYSTCPVCIPQRLTFLTGKLASTHGVMANVGIPHFPMETSLPKELGKGGYQTALVGRGFHTYPSDDPVGFEYFVPGDPTSELRNTPADHFYQFLRDNTPNSGCDYFANGTDKNSTIATPFHLSNEFHHTQWTTDRALEFFEKRDSSRPFFLTVGYFSPHGPQNPPAEFFNRYYYSNAEFDDPAIAEWDIPPVANWTPNNASYVNLQGELLRSCRAGYYGNITFADFQIGRILNAVSLMPNTYVIFTSDHGEQLGDHYLYHKARPYQGASRIPFIISGPNISPMQVCDAPVGWHDIMPTVLELADLPCPDGLDGSSIVPLLNNHDAVDWREYLHGECSLYKVSERLHHKLPGQQVEGNTIYEEGWHYLTDGKFKYIWYTTSGREQLFNLIEDKDEKNDLVLSGGYEETLEVWRKRLVETLKDRSEGFSDGESLKPGCEYKFIRPNAQELMQQRIKEGLDIAYVYYHKPNPVL